MYKTRLGGCVDGVKFQTGYVETDLSRRYGRFCMWSSSEIQSFMSSVHRRNCNGFIPRSISSRILTMIRSLNSTQLGSISNVELSTSSPRCSPLAHLESIDRGTRVSTCERLRTGLARYCRV